jgi:hypothetical protein
MGCMTCKNKHCILPAPCDPPSPPQRCLIPPSAVHHCRPSLATTPAATPHRPSAVCGSHPASTLLSVAAHLLLGQLLCDETLDTSLNLPRDSAPTKSNPATTEVDCNTPASPRGLQVWIGSGAGGGSAVVLDSMSQSIYILKCLAERAKFIIHLCSQFDPSLYIYTPPYSA